MKIVDVRKAPIEPTSPAPVTDSIQDLRVESIDQYLVEILTAIRDQDLLEGKGARIEITGELGSHTPMQGYCSQYLRLNINPWVIPKLVAYRDDWNSNPLHWDGMMFDKDREPGWYCIKIMDLRP